MLRIAVQAKGRLFEETMALLEESDIKLSTTKRTLLVQSSNFPIEVLFLRDDDIPQTVATGVADLGVIGENEFMEKEEDAEIIKRLGFSKCRLSLAMPKDLEYPGLSWFNGKKIATSYPVILRNFLKEKGVNAEIHVITGSVEVSPGIGLADAIFDIVTSGKIVVRIINILCQHSGTRFTGRCIILGKTTVNQNIIKRNPLSCQCFQHQIMSRPKCFFRER